MMVPKRQETLKFGRLMIGIMLIPDLSKKDNFPFFSHGGLLDNPGLVTKCCGNVIDKWDQVTFTFTLITFANFVCDQPFSLFSWKLRRQKNFFEVKKLNNDPTIRKKERASTILRIFSSPLFSRLYRVTADHVTDLPNHWLSFLLWNVRQVIGCQRVSMWLTFEAKPNNNLIRTPKKRFVTLKYNNDNWEPYIMTIIVTWQLGITLDSIRNSCDVWTLWGWKVENSDWTLAIQ